MKVIAIAFVLASPSLLSPLVADDLIHQIRIDPTQPIPGWDDPNGPYFVFADGTAEQRAQLMQEGVFSWWTAEDFKLAFWRPISEATHRLDDTLFGENSVLIHLHSLLWFALVLLALSRLYERFHMSRVAVLALCIYALDDTRGMVLGFASNRNALIAVFFSVCTLIAHDRWRRDGWSPGAYLGPLIFVAALLSGEFAIATTAYLFAYALFIDEHTLKRRVMSLLPYALLTVTWALLYRYQGYGTMNSGIYIHPLADPIGFFSKLIERLPVLVLGQVAGLPSDLGLLYPPAIKAVILLLGGGLVIGLAWLLVPLMKRSRVLSFWVVGATLSLLPVCATFTNDRLLGMIAIGASGALAVLMAYAIERPASRGARIGISALVTVHLVLAPLALPVRSMTMNLLNSVHERTNAAIPADDSVTQRTLVIPQALSDGSVCYHPIRRAANHTPRPKAMRLLSTGYQRVDVTRLDLYTLSVEPEQGFYATEGEQMTRHPSLPFAVEDRVELSDMRVTITKVNAHGRAMSAEFRFDAPLEAPKWLWMQFVSGHTLEPWTPPALGERATLPPLL